MTLDMKALLAVEHRNLNPDNEMRRIFGSRVVQAEQSRRGRNRVYRKSSWLTRPKDNWPKFGKTGLSMNAVELASTSCKYFVLEHSKQYQKVQFQFLDAVESLNPQIIMDLTSVHPYHVDSLLQLLFQDLTSVHPYHDLTSVHPYHVDSLLQLSEICKMSEDLQMAAELIERALYVFECGFHPLFSLTQGNCRIGYCQAENRAFFLALFRHLVFVGERGCYHTSLEFCKLILSLDPDDDPLCILLMIDFYALRSEQYSFLIRMFNEWEAHRNLSQLPNFAFSVPLAMFHQATVEERDLAQADEMLQDSLMMFPSILTTLMDKCGVVIDSQVAAHAFFGQQAELGQTDALRHLVALYVGRGHACWKEPEVLVWLERNVKEVLRRVDSNDPLPNEYAERRKNRYTGTPRNIYRHIIISEIKEAKATLPPELASSPVLSYDPLPPLDSVASYERPERRRRVQESGPLSMFFRSLLPNFNIQELAEDEPAAGAAGGARANLQEGIGAVMDAMRDLLQNIRPVAPPVEGGEQQDNDGNGANNDGDGADDELREEWD
ncbi:Transcription factor 25 [Lamellibrachia satsuma]|nr:Transcription factor 25 [Lamellibrachia satsuma]